MKANNIDGKIKLFGTLPKTWKNILNFNLSSVSLQQEQGFYDIVYPEYNTETQKLRELYFDEENLVYTYINVSKTRMLKNDIDIKKIPVINKRLSELIRIIDWPSNMEKWLRELREAIHAMENHHFMNNSILNNKQPYLLPSILEKIDE